jgi:hypothetical protein
MMRFWVKRKVGQLLHLQTGGAFERMSGEGEHYNELARQ